MTIMLELGHIQTAVLHHAALQMRSSVAGIPAKE